MSRKRMVIIGGGVAGMATGIYAQQNGYDTTIFEQHSIPGGVCTSWKRKGYTIDGCIHWLMGCRPEDEMYRVYQEVGVIEPDSLIPIREYGRFLDEEGGSELHVTADIDRLEREMLELGPEDGKLIRQLCQAVRKCAEFPMPVLAPTDLMGFGERMRFYTKMLPFIPTLAKFMKPMDEFCGRFKSDKLKMFLPMLFVPEMPVLFGIILLSQLQKGQLAGYRGGSLLFAQRMAKRYQGLGGDLRLKSKVQRVMVKEQKAVGVVLDDGSEVEADIVVSAADGHSTIVEMLGGGFTDEKIKHIYKHWPRFTPICMITYGVNNDLGGGVEATSMVTQEEIRCTGRTSNKLHFRSFHHDQGLAPEGHSIVQVIVEAEWSYWKGLASDRPAYDAAKEKLAEEILGVLSPIIPGMKGNVEMVDVATPYTTWRYTLNQNGYYEGFLMTPEAFRNPPPKTLPGLGGFHMVGQWVEPGGGIPPCLFGPRHLVMRLCRDAKREFVSNLP